MRTRWRFAAGKAYFHIDGSYRVGTYKNQIDSFEWGVVPLPMKDGVKGSCGTFWTNGITANTTGVQLDASVKFLQFLTSEDVMKRWTEEVGEVGARVSITEDEELTKDPIMKPFIDATALCNFLLLRQRERRPPDFGRCDR